MVRGLLLSVLGCALASVVLLFISYTVWHSTIEGEVANTVGYMSMYLVLLFAAAIFQYFVWKLYRGSKKYFRLTALNFLSAFLHTATYTFAVFLLLNVIDPSHFDYLLEKDVGATPEVLAYFKKHYFSFTIVSSLSISLPVQLLATTVILISTRKNDYTGNVLDAQQNW